MQWRFQLGWQLTKSGKYVHWTHSSTNRLPSVYYDVNFKDLLIILRLLFKMIRQGQLKTFYVSIYNDWGGGWGMGDGGLT